MRYTDTNRCQGVSLCLCVEGPRHDTLDTCAVPVVVCQVVQECTVGANTSLSLSFDDGDDEPQSYARRPPSPLVVQRVTRYPRIRVRLHCSTAPGPGQVG